MERKLQQCPCCKEWFNTTFAVMTDHYKAKHEFLIKKAFKIAELSVNMAFEDARSKVTLFPECMQHYVAARVIENQISMVASATPPNQMDVNREKFLVGVQTAFGISKQAD